MRGLGKWLALAGCMAVLSACATTEPKPAKPQEILSTPSVNFASKINANYEIQDCNAFWLRAKELTQQPNFAENFDHLLSRKIQLLYISRMFDCHTELKNYDAAIRLVPILLQNSPNEEFSDWMRATWLELAVATKKPLVGLQALQDIANKPEKLNTLKDDAVSWEWYNLKFAKDPEATRFEFAKLLTQNGYTGNKGILRKGRYAKEYADGLMRRHNVAESKKVLLEYPRLYDWIGVNTQTLYATLHKEPGFTKQFSIETAFQADMDFWQKAMKEHPDSLDAIQTAAELHRIQGNYEMARKLAEEAIQNVEASKDPEHPPYMDIEGHLRWVINDLAYTYAALGEEDKALATMKKASELKENGGDNVSQIINLAHLQLQYGHDQDAIQTISHLEKGPVSGFGMGFVHSIRTCAYQELGETEKARAELVETEKLNQENRSAWKLALLCMNDQDRTANAYINDLRNPVTQDSTLRALQKWQRPPHETAWTKKLYARRNQLLQRQDVQDTLHAAGRIVDIPFYSSYWGDF